DAAPALGGGGGAGADHRPRARRRRASPAGPRGGPRPRRHCLLRRSPAPAAPFPPHDRLLGLGPLQARALPARPAGIHRPRRRRRLLGHPRPPKSDRRAAGVAGRTRGKKGRSQSTSRPLPPAGSPHPPPPPIVRLGAPPRPLSLTHAPT